MNRSCLLFVVMSFLAAVALASTAQAANTDVITPKLLWNQTITPADGWYRDWSTPYLDVPTKTLYYFGTIDCGQEISVKAFDADSGAIKWTHIDTNPVFCLQNKPPPVSDRHIFYFKTPAQFSPNGAPGLVAIDKLTGKHSWTFNLTTSSFEISNIETIGDVVTFTVENKAYGLSATSGKLLWTFLTIFPNVVTISKAVTPQHPNGVFYFMDKVVRCIDAMNGRELWRFGDFQVKNLQPYDLGGATYDQKANMLVIPVEPLSLADTYVHGVDATTGAGVWVTKVKETYAFADVYNLPVHNGLAVSAVSVMDGSDAKQRNKAKRVLTSSGRPTAIVAFNVTTGATVWWRDASVAFYTGFVTIDGAPQVLYVDQKSFHALSATTGSPLVSTSLGYDFCVTHHTTGVYCGLMFPAVGVGSQNSILYSVAGGSTQSASMFAVQL